MRDNRFIERLVKRFRQIPILWSIVRRLPYLSRRRGVRNILHVAWRFHSDGSGPVRFAQWCLEALAYEARDDPAAYRDWIARVEAPRRGVPDSEISSCGGEPVCICTSLPMPDVARRVVAAAGRYVLFTHEDALLAPAAARRMLLSAIRTDADLVYCDEDEIQGGGRCYPFFKPDFSIDLARSEDFIGPVYLLRTRVAQRLLGNVSDDPAAFVYDIPLRLYERKGRVDHVAEVLVHWRRRRDRRLAPHQLLCRSAHLARCYGSDLAKYLVGEAGSFGAWTTPGQALVSIIIPTRDRVDLLATCLDSIYRSEPTVPFEVVILDNRSKLAETREWFDSASRRYPNLTVLEADYEFNWSRLNNQGIAASSGRVLVFLNNDIEVIQAHWLERLAAQALRPDVGAVGAMLLFPDGTIQHAGVTLGLGGFADHIYSGTPIRPADRHVFVHPVNSRNVSVCTGACLAIERSKLEAVSGFDEALKICGDVAVCIGLLEKGLLIVYEADVRLTHYESATRSRAPLSSRELEAAMRICASYIDRGDAWYNRNLSLRSRYPMLAGSARGLS